MKKLLFKATLGLMGMMGTLAIGVVNAGNYVTTVPGLVVTGEQDGQIFEYGVLKFDDGRGHIIMLLDRNLGATMTGAGADANTGSYGFKYQWGNNYGFGDGCWTYGCSDLVTENITSTKTQWNENYENNGYSGTRFIADNSCDDYWEGNMHYDGLRGGSGDNVDNRCGLSGKTEQGIKNRQGPCPEGYHVPSIQERNNLFTYWYNIEEGENLSATILQDGSYAEDLSKAFYIPNAGWRSIDGKIYDIKVGSYLRSSSPDFGGNSLLFTLKHNMWIWDGLLRAYGFSMRCFYNYFNRIVFYTNSESKIEPEIIYGNYTGVKPTDPTKTGYIFDGWFLDNGTFENEFNFNSILTEDVNLYAQRTPKEYKIDYTLNDGIISGENVTGYTIESGDITLINPAKNGYTFTGWSGTDIEGLSLSVTIPSGSTGNRSYEANWQINQYTITFDTDGGTNIPPITADYGTGITVPANPTKNGYTFKGRDREIPSTMPAENITVKAKWDRNGSSGGGGGGGSSNKSKDEQKSTETPKDQASSGTTVKEPKTNTGNKEGIETGSLVDTPEQAPENDNPTQDTTTNNQQGQNNTQKGGTYSTEFQEAYEFAHEKGITTMPTIEKANMNGKLTRIAMAKMLSYYAINVLGQKPDETRNNKFNDITDKLDAQYDSGVTLAFQLGIMGINMPDNKFRPNDEVTRAEFATALSRMLYSTPDGKPYYTTHLEKLKEEGILKNDDYKMKELRGYVMIMLMRSAK